MVRYLILFCLALAGSARAQVSDPLLFQERIHDFGEVREEGGKAEFEFVFTNTTNRTIRILAVQTSCGCTTPGWTKEPVAPGKNGFVKASFDPRGRPGYFNKSLTVTSDAMESPLVLQIKGSVVTGKAPVANSEFPVSSGVLKLRTQSFNVGKVYLNKPAERKKFTVLNDAQKPVAILSVKATDGWQVELPASLPAGAISEVAVSYQAQRIQQYGFQTGSVDITTDDAQQPLKTFSLFATVEEFFPPLTAEESAVAPVLGIESLTVELGRIRAGNTVERALWLKNAGKKELSIRALQPNCTCLTATVEKTTLKPGELTRLKLSFNTEGRKYLQQKAITVYSNDPRTPVQRITITANVAE